MPFGRIRQSKMASNTSTTISVLLDKAPIEGNALVAIHFTGATHSNGVSGFGTPTVTMLNGVSIDEGKAHVKIAGVSESRTVSAANAAAESEGNMLTVLEIEGPFTASSQVDIAYAGPVVGGTSTYTISAGTTSQAREIAIAFLMMRTPEEYGLNTWTNGFHQYGMTISSPEKTLCLAVKELNSISSLSTVATMYASNTCMGGMITLKANASVIAPPSPGDGYWTAIATPAASRALANVNPDPTNTADYKGSNGQESIIDAWSGAIIRQPVSGSTLEYIIEAAGGHGNYFGNEGYTLDLLAVTVAWARHRNPTSATANLSLNDSDGVDALGNALARHTYNYQCYDWDNDEFVFFGGNALAGGSATASAKVLRLKYSINKTTWVTSGVADVPTFGGSEAAWHAWYIGDGEFIVCPGGGNGYAKYIKSSNSYVVSNTNGLLGSMPYGCSLWDSKRARMVIFGYHASEITLLNPIVGGAAEQATSGVPGGLTFSDDGTGGVYDNYLDKYVFWQGGTALYFLDPITYVWSTRSLPTQTVTPTAPTPNGTFNRFAYISPTATYSQGAYIVVNGVDESTYLFSASDSGGGSITVSASTLSASSSLRTITVVASTSKNVSVPTVSATYSIQAPAIVAIKNATPSIGVFSVSGSLATPSLSRGSTVALGVIGFTGAIPAPTISTGVNTTLSVGFLSGTHAIGNPTVLTAGGVVVPLAILNGSYAFQSAQINTGSSVVVGPISGSYSVAAIQIGTGTTYLANPIGGSISIPAPTVSTVGNVVVQMSVLSATASIPDPVVQTNINTIVMVGFLSGILSLSTPTIVGNSSNVLVNVDPINALLSMTNPLRVIGRSMPRLTQIKLEVQSLISGMTVSNGYNFTYGSMNQYDLNQMVFPAITCRFNREENLNRNTNDSYLYLNSVDFEIEAYLRNETTDPAYDEDSEMNKILDDFKQVFGWDFQPAQCNSCLYQESERIYSIDENNPAKLKMKFRIEYYQEIENVTRPG
jgi:hypothetical protein